MRSTLIYSISLLLLALSGILFSSAKAIEVSDLHFTELNKQHGLSDTAVLDIVEERTHQYIKDNAELFPELSVTLCPKLSIIPELFPELSVIA